MYGAGELGWAVGQIAPARARAEEAVQIFRTLGDRRRLAYALQALPLANDHPRSEESVAESLSLFAELGDAWGTAMATAAVDLVVLMHGGDPSGHGRARLEEALGRFRVLGDDWGAAQMLSILGDLARRKGDAVTATARYEEALALLRRQDLTRTVPSLLQNLGSLALRAGQTRRALGLPRESMALFRGQGDQRGMADCLDGLAGVLAVMGQAERAAQFFGAAEALRQTIGATIWPGNIAEYERGIALLRERLGEPALAAALAAGRARSLRDVIAGVLEVEPARE